MLDSLQIAARCNKLEKRLILAERLDRIRMYNEVNPYISHEEDDRITTALRSIWVGSGFEADGWEPHEPILEFPEAIEQRKFTKEMILADFRNKRSVSYQMMWGVRIETPLKQLIDSPALSNIITGITMLAVPPQPYLVISAVMDEPIDGFSKVVFQISETRWDYLELAGRFIEFK